MNPILDTGITLAVLVPPLQLLGRPRLRALTAALLALSVVLSLLVPTPVAAQTATRSATALRFDVDLAIQPDGSLIVRETQEIAFSGGPFSKATRRIPMRRVTGLGNVRVDIDGQALRGGSGSPGTYSVSGPLQGTSSGEAVIEYWFPQTFSARRTFVVEYTVRGAISFYDGGDQLRWNALAADRAYPVARSTITLRLPSSASGWQIDAYPRSLLDPGQPRAAQGTIATWNAVNVPASQPLEIRAQWPHGLVAGTAPIWQEEVDREAWRRENLRPLLDVAFGTAGLVVPVAGLLAILVAWYARGRDPSVGAVPSELDEPPSDLSPALVGVVVDERADVHDVVATVLDLAARGALRITESAEQTPVGIRRDFQLVLADRAVATHDFERLVLDSLFHGDEVVRLSQVGDWFGSSVPQLQRSLHAAAHREGLFTGDPEVVRRRYQRLGSLLTGVAVALGFVACSLAGEYTDVAGWPFIGLLVVGMVLRFASGSMPRRTAAGTLEAARWRAYGRHLARLGPKAWNRGIDSEDDEAEAVERTLPYAVALGVDRAWVQKFIATGTRPPRWMQGPPVVVVGGPSWGGPMGMPGGGYWGPGQSRSAPGRGGPSSEDLDSGGGGAPPVLGGDALNRGSNSLADLLNAASEALSHGGGSGWSGGGSGGGSFSGGSGGGGGGGSSFE